MTVTNFIGKSIEEVIKEPKLAYMFTLVLLGDDKNHPYILIGHYKNELKATAFYKCFKVHVSRAEDFENPEVLKGYDTLLIVLRNRAQAMFDRYIAPNLDPESPMVKNRVDVGSDKYNQLAKEKAGKEFIKNNIVDYGNETVAQIASRLNISKAEVRRRKQNGEPL